MLPDFKTSKAYTVCQKTMRRLQYSIFKNYYDWYSLSRFTQYYKFKHNYYQPIYN